MSLEKDIEDALGRAKLSVLEEVDILVACAVNQLFNEAWIHGNRLLTPEQVCAIFGNRLALYLSDEAVAAWHLARREKENGVGN